VVKLPAVALQIIAAPQHATIAPRVQVRRTRSASTPNGTVATAATSDATVTSRPRSVLLIARACRSCVADAPTVATSALLRPSTPASTKTTRARAAPPRIPVRRSRPDAAAVAPDLARRTMTERVLAPAATATLSSFRHSPLRPDTAGWPLDGVYSGPAPLRGRATRSRWDAAGRAWMYSRRRSTAVVGGGSGSS
jgi:hypothetical protein